MSHGMLEMLAKQRQADLLREASERRLARQAGARSA